MFYIPSFLIYIQVYTRHFHFNKMQYPTRSCIYTYNLIEFKNYIRIRMRIRVQKYTMQTTIRENSCIHNSHAVLEFKHMHAYSDFLYSKVTTLVYPDNFT